MLNDAGRASTAGRSAPASRGARSSWHRWRWRLCWSRAPGSSFAASFGFGTSILGSTVEEFLPFALRCRTRSTERPRARLQYFDRLIAAVAATPGVRAVGLTNWLPLGDGRDNTTLAVEDRPVPPNSVPPVHDRRARGQQLLRCHADAHAIRPNVRSARRRAPHTGSRRQPGVRQSGIGARQTLLAGGFALGSTGRGTPSSESSATYTSSRSTNRRRTPSICRSSCRGTIWRPMSPRTSRWPYAPMAIPAALLSSVRDVVRGIDPTLPTFQEQTMSQVVAQASARTRFTMLLLCTAAAVALLLGGVGIYGVMAYGVSLRRREIGVRLALGAQPADVSQMVSRQGILLAAIGVAYRARGGDWGDAIHARVAVRRERHRPAYAGRHVRAPAPRRRLSPAGFLRAAPRRLTRPWRLRTD